MISDKLQKALNGQIAAELWSSNLYLQMSFFLKHEGWDGSACWMAHQAEEERGHALKMAGYLLSRGGAANIPGNGCRSSGLGLGSGNIRAYLRARVQSVFNDKLHCGIGY